MNTLTTVLPVFLVIGCGWFLRRIGFLSGETSISLKRLVFYVSAPALLLRGVASAPLQETVNAQVLLLVIGVTCAFAAVVYICAAGTAPSRRGVLAQGAHRSNMVFMGLPVVTYAFGESVLGTTAVLIGVMVLLYNFLGVLLLVLPHRKLSSRQPLVWRDAASKVLRNPLIIGCGGGILLAAVGLSLPVSLDRFLELLGRTALPLALLAVGAEMNFSRLRAEAPVTALVSVLKLVVYPGLMYVGLRWLGLTGTALAVPVLVLASPTAVVSYIMACQMDGDEQLSGAIVIGTTTASLVTYVAWLAFLGVAV